MDITARRPLGDLNTLALPGVAEYFCEVTNLDELRDALAFSRERALAVTPWGGGSNIVLAGDIRGLVMRIALKGIVVTEQANDSVLVKVGAGEVWHDLVCTMLRRHYYGLENLSLIPGLVGAAPMQNIGAYGAEISDSLVELEAVNIATGELRHFSREQCKFGYRNSVFKNELRDAYVITAVTLCLQKTPHLNIEYPALRQAVMALQTPRLTAELIAGTVCNIRRQKLPDPLIEPNVGSFFKNPVVPAAQGRRLQGQFPDIVLFPQVDSRVKIAAAWLIDRAGWKGRLGDRCRVHPGHALVLSNTGAASGADILALAGSIAADVEQRFGIALEMEPRVLGG